MDDEQQPPEQPDEVAPILRLQPGGTRDQAPGDGSIHRVHLFVVVNEDGAMVTEQTDAGPKPILIASVPLRIKGPDMIARSTGGILH